METTSLLTKHLGRGSPQVRALFHWLWGQVQLRCARAECRATERYIGFYGVRGDKETIFAYVDPQTDHIRIGVFVEHIDRFAPEMQTQPFPRWNSRGLTGLVLDRQEDAAAILNFLADAYHDSRLPKW